MDEAKAVPNGAAITPNLPEAEALCGMRVRDEAEMERAARLLSDQTGAAVLLKGGHLAKTADDLLLQNGEAHWLQGRRWKIPIRMAPAARFPLRLPVA